MTTLQPAESANKLSAVTVIKDKLMSLIIQPLNLSGNQRKICVR